MSVSEPKLNNTVASKLDPNTHRARNNAMGMMALVASIREQEREIHEGGGAKSIEAQHAKKRLTARERIALLLDPKTELFELSLFAAFKMYEEWGGAPSAGVVTGLGRVAKSGGCRSI
jgi:3-methylcrotonyl-CoA carboxylase beta subunit